MVTAEPEPSDGPLCGHNRMREAPANESLVAEGDPVVARWTIEVPTTGKTISARGLTYYRVADGRIVEDEPFVTPDLMQELGLQGPPPSA